MVRNRLLQMTLESILNFDVGFVWSKQYIYIYGSYDTMLVNQSFDTMI